MTTILTVSQRKGGVGKTVTSTAIAHGLSLQGKSVLVIDLDPQGHVCLALGLEQEPGVYNLLAGGRTLREVTRDARPNLRIVPGNQRTSSAEHMLVYEQAKVDRLSTPISKGTNGRPDYIIFDTPPGGVGTLQRFALFLSDLVLIPTAVDYLSTAGLIDMIDDLNKLKGDGWHGGILGILPTFYEERINESQRNKTELDATFGDLVLPEIHRATVLRECTAAGKTIFEFAPDTRAAREYAALVWTVINATQET